ncbi:MAG: hypothetical protein H0U74_15745 [Bradymonadaceae bacterium]|nr:hypothetical protein [Lujinxingiaceae bacterium]
MQDLTPNTGITRGVALASAIILGLAGIATLAHAALPQAPGGPFDAAAVARLTELNLTHVYGLNAADVGWLTGALSQSFPAMSIAPYPGGEAFAGAVLTRSQRVDHWLPPKHAVELEVEPLGDGWTLLLPPGGIALPNLPQIAAATVVLRAEDGSEKPCSTYRNGRFQCRKPGWSYVGQAKVRVAGKSESCIWAHPLQDATIIVAYPSTQPTEGRKLVLETALTDGSVGGGHPVDVRVSFGTKNITHVHPDRKGWTRKTIPRSDDAAALTVEVSAAHTGRRHFCYRFVEQ